ncbi:NAD-dependent epimerase/dehydratase family protein [Helicobacter marmotae]|uniref:NAD-dependent epimerase/dehydratase family protein n=1 Tax=Helicobacter marmotae TaxID=152490 RepID=UPI001F2A435E|nr:NAD-dependent epimerase/dehydratase family protein [Helicobacter marmotae]
MTILITGGAGYIGSVTNALLNTLNIKTIVLDNLSLGHKAALEFAPLDTISPLALTFLSHLERIFNGGGG